uniref:DUF4283 domain-containing protein n=1 Tax=Ananas comosus var. bracteatus TaxID=296719 RepID=A0A6V7QUJ1_ANACO
MRVYVPYTKEYLRRRELRRNAVLADVIQPANLGTNPQRTIATVMARRFGGYTEDFGVTRYRDRDFAIFLPEWVSAEVLTRREECTPHRVAYRAWIRLINLPFESWTVARVAALVCGFRRFVKADDTTKAMTDLKAFICQITLDNLSDIPQNLSIVVGEEIFSVMVHLERERIAEDGGADPPAPPPQDGSGNGNQQLRGRRENQPGNGNHNLADEEMGELNKVRYERSVNLRPWISAVRRTSPEMGLGLMYSRRPGAPLDECDANTKERVRWVRCLGPKIERTKARAECCSNMVVDQKEASVSKLSVSVSKTIHSQLRTGEMPRATRPKALVVMNSEFFNRGGQPLGFTSLELLKLGTLLMTPMGGHVIFNCSGDPIVKVFGPLGGVKSWAWAWNFNYELDGYSVDCGLGRDGPAIQEVSCGPLVLKAAHNREYADHPDDNAYARVGDCENGWDSDKPAVDKEDFSVRRRLAYS